MNELDLKESKKKLKHRTHERSYIKDGNIMWGLLLMLKKMLNRKRKFNRNVFSIFFLILEKKNNKQLEVLM